MPGEDRALREAAEVLALVAEPDRLRVVAALALGAVSTDEVVAASGVDRRAALRALTRLESGGLVGSRARGWALLVDRLGEVVRAAAPALPPEDHGASDPGAAAVLRAFVREGRLTQIPAVRSKRLVVLDHVVRVFEPGVRYAEKDVNVALRAFHPDHAALRRYLVDEGFLSRDSGTYWRSGGSVDV